MATDEYNACKEKIRSCFKGDIDDGPETLKRYSRDYSIFSVQPKLVVFPKDTEDVEKLVAFAEEERRQGKNISLTGRSAGTDMGGGPLNDGIIVEFARYMNRIGELTDESIRVEPGVYFHDLEPKLKERGLLYPSYPASKDLCALGGMLSNNSGGEKSLAYGKTEDYVEELDMVWRDGKKHTIRPLSKSELEDKMKQDDLEGEVYRNVCKLIEDNRALIEQARPQIHKNSAGYYLWNVWDGKTFNLQKLLVGSQGTLGLVVGAKLRLLKAKRYQHLAVVFLNDVKPLADIIVATLKFHPESLESYDDKTFRIALKFIPEIMKLMKGNALVLAWQFLPELFMVLKGGVPRMLILAEFTSDDKGELDARVRQFMEAMKPFGVRVRNTRSEREAEKYFTIRRQSFNLLHSHAEGRYAAPFIDDLIVKPEYLPKFLPELDDILARYKDKMLYTVAGHPGDGNFHIIPLMDMADASVRAAIPQLMHEVYNLVLSYHGSITAEHNDGLIRSSYLKQMYGDKVYRLFEEVKRIFDPDGIFNPRKKVGLTWADAERCIIKGN